jgi:signal transduction histidine kinase
MRRRLGLWLAAPALILLSGHVRGCRVAARHSDPRAHLDAVAARITGRLDALVEQTRQAARSARDDGPDAARRSLPGALVPRLEGLAVLRDGAFLAWSGSPADPEAFGEAGETVRVIRRGIRTSLLARTADDAKGQAGAASVALEIQSGAITTDELLRSSSVRVEVRWGATDDDAATPVFDPGPPAVLVSPWRAADGRTLATLTLQQGPAEAQGSRSRASGRAWAGLAAAFLAIVALWRRRAAVDGRRLAWVTGGIVLARAALAWGRTFEELLPRSLGSASLYGRGESFGLLSSPAALAATAVAFYLLYAVWSRWAAGALARGVRTAWVPAAILAGGGVATTFVLAGSLARDARISVPRIDPGNPGALLLSLAGAFVLVGTAEAIATLTDAWLRGRPAAPRGRAAVVLALVPLCALAVLELHRTSETIVEERLRSEYAPLVRDQSARRRVALIAAVGDAAASPAVAAVLADTVGAEDRFLAYGLWVDSDLFHQGFASSLDLYDAAGARRGHFEFAFPQVGGARETTPHDGGAGALTVETETVPIGSTLLSVVHAERNVIDPASGRILGRAVGHVLEEPSNLPFLPGSAPYLEALGRGHAQPSDRSAESPDYVLFDDSGRVEISTLHQPPAPGSELRAAAAAGRRIDIEAGDTLYRVLPVEDAGKLHLLMTPAPTVLDAAGDAVRLLLLALAILAAGAAGATLTAPGGATAIADLVRGSFRRKLLVALLVASVLPLVGLAVFLRTYIERRSEANLADAAATVVGAAQRVVEDYQSVGDDDPAVPPLRLNDEALSWLRRVVGQEIHLYEDGEVAATSKPELFDSGLLPTRLPGDVDRAVVRGGQPVLLRREQLGAIPLPVAYAPVDVRGGPRDAVIAVPLVLEQRAFVRSVDRLVEILLLLTTGLVAMLAASSALLARSVAGPVRRLADASRRIAGGDYGARVTSTSRDEMGALMGDFNVMARALADQRADLVRRRDYIEALLRHATTGVISTDAGGRIVTINPAAEALLRSASGTAARGERLDEAFARRPGGAALAAAVSDPSAVGTAVEVDVGSGEHAARLRIVRVLLPDPGGSEVGSLVLLDDVTSSMKSNQLAAWAEMARAIAHEIKNPLTPIQLAAEHARRLLTDRGVLPSPEIESCLDTIVRQVRELRDISSAFSAYAKIPDLAKEPVDPAAFVQEVLAPYAGTPPPGIRFELRSAATKPILADRRILARAVVNLIENALQAMPDGGTVTLTVADDGPESVAIDVRDEGPGLSPEIRRRLFEPYFSTKSSGTGLGLAIARRAVEAHGGTIESVDMGGRGTVFRIRIPAILRP